MSIDVGCGREGAVSEPDLNLFHGDSFAEKQAGTSIQSYYKYVMRWSKFLMSEVKSVLKTLKAMLVFSIIRIGLMQYRNL